MNDSISRRAAIDALISESRTVEGYYTLHERIIYESDAIEAISLLPSTERKGQWIKVNHNERKCSVCGNHELWMNAAVYDYCPHCGVKMEAEE